jgi:hypothetical protein
MRGSVPIVVVLSILALGVVPAMASPGSGPREDIDQSFTTTAVGTPTGLDYTSHYHAAGDASQPPPPMRKMVFYAPPGFRFDTNVPEKCTASDAELAFQGPAACPAGSKIGDGTTEGLFYYPFTDVLFDHFKHNLYIFNNTNEQILLVESEGYTVQRGIVHPDNSIEFNPTTCFPASPTGECPDEYIIQLGSTTKTPALTNSRGSYATTPPTCPRTKVWSSTVSFWWSDGSKDDVVTTQPCKPAPKATARKSAKRKATRRHRRTRR